jgi:hypothetical protein
MELAKRGRRHLEEVTEATERGIQRIRDSLHLAYSVPTALRPIPMVSSDPVAGTSEPLF